MGLILDSTYLIAAERQGRSVLQLLESIEATFGSVDLGISVISIAELVHGAYRAQDQSRQQRRLAFIDRVCSDVPIYPMTLDIARRVGRMEAELAERGTTLAFEDLAIGATALQLGYELVTANVRHFRLMPGLKVLTA
jgi:tRNA(fMet)-specific endonuclease VapC